MLQVSGMWVSGMQVSGWLLEFYFPWGTRMQIFSTLKINEQTLMPTGLAELEQPHVEPNSGQSTSLHHSSTHCSWQRAGPGLETRLGMSKWSSQGLHCSYLWSQTVSVVDIWGSHSQTDTNYTLQARCQATPMWCMWGMMQVCNVLQLTTVSETHMQWRH